MTRRPGSRRGRVVSRACSRLLVVTLLALSACDTSSGSPDAGTVDDLRPKPAGALRMTIFELPVHGLAIAIETPSGALHFVDTGGKEEDGSSGKEVLAPFIRACGASEIAGIVISHPDRDHFEGARHLLKHFKVRAFCDALAADVPVPGDYVELRERARASGAAVRVLHAGDVLDWDPALEITVLAPPQDGIATKEKNRDNDHSLVLRIRHGTQVFLLPGDIETAGARSLLATIPAATLRADVLVAPHHGFFTEARFAEAVAPKTVVVSCLAEYDDKQPRIPARQAEQLFGAVGAKVWVTAWDGTVTITSDGGRCEVGASRKRE